MNAGFRPKLQPSTAGLLVALACLLPMWAISQTSGNAAAGRVVAKQRCVYCHGPDGNGNKGSYAYQRGEIPRIAGLPEAYFIKSMREFKEKHRPQGDMQTVAEQLSDDDVRNVAAWFANQPPSATPTYEQRM